MRVHDSDTDVSDSDNDDFHNDALTWLRDALRTRHAGPSGQLPVVLSIAGSDPSGGAGVQADLKTATALGAYGAAAITSLTVQNTRGVTDVHVVPANFVADQCRAVLTDLNVAAIKIGMLASADIAVTVAHVLADHPAPAVVLDPVMVAASGDRLVAEETVTVIAERLAGLATVITPNLSEAGELANIATPSGEREMVTAASALCRLGPAVLLKGGHLPAEQRRSGPDVAASDGHDGTAGRTIGDSTGDVTTGDSGDPEVYRDLLVGPAGDGDPGNDHCGRPRWFTAPSVHTINNHGTGCTLSTALAVGLGAGLELPDAVAAAKSYLTGALRSAANQQIGHGSGPVDHLWLNRTPDHRGTAGS